MLVQKSYYFCKYTLSSPERQGREIPRSLPRKFAEVGMGGCGMRVERRWGWMGWRWEWWSGVGWWSGGAEGRGRGAWTLLLSPAPPPPPTPSSGRSKSEDLSFEIWDPLGLLSLALLGPGERSARRGWDSRSPRHSGAPTIWGEEEMWTESESPGLFSERRVLWSTRLGH